MVARSVGLEHTNLGFAGQCMLDPFVARTIRDSDADAISLKVAANIIAEDAMRERPFGPALHGFLDTIREGKPDTPILVVSPIFSPERRGPCGAADSQRRRSRRGCRGPRGDPAHQSHHAQDARGDRIGCRGASAASGTTISITVSGLDLFGPADAGDLPDDLHPNETGNERIAERFATIAFGAGGPLASHVG